MIESYINSPSQIPKIGDRVAVDDSANSFFDVIDISEEVYERYTRYWLLIKCTKSKYHHEVGWKYAQYASDLIVMNKYILSEQLCMFQFK